jgi:hypothetical protein
VNIVDVLSIHVLIWNTEPTELILRKGRENRENNGRMDLTGEHFTHIWKCHNENHCTTVIY